MLSQLTSDEVTELMLDVLEHVQQHQFQIVNSVSQNSLDTSRIVFPDNGTSFEKIHEHLTKPKDVVRAVYVKLVKEGFLNYIPSTNQTPNNYVHPSPIQPPELLRQPVDWEDAEKVIRTINYSQPVYLTDRGLKFLETHRPQRIKKTR